MIIEFVVSCISCTYLEYCQITAIQHKHAFEIPGKNKLGTVNVVYLKFRQVFAIPLPIWSIEIKKKKRIQIVPRN